MKKEKDEDSEDRRFLAILIDALPEILFLKDYKFTAKIIEGWGIRVIPVGDRSYTLEVGNKFLKRIPPSVVGEEVVRALVNIVLEQESAENKKEWCLKVILSFYSTLMRLEGLLAEIEIRMSRVDPSLNMNDLPN